MVETIMYFGIGFLCASLLGLVIVPLVHNRAVRLTVRRLEAATPVSIAEIQADKDQLRAEFAISTRRLELSIEQLKAQYTAQLSELGKKTEAITILKHELGEKTETILALEAREKALQEELHAKHEESGRRGAAMQETEHALAEKVAALAKATAELDERTLTADAQRVEITAMRTQIEALQLQLERFEKDASDSHHRLARERSDADAAGNTEERSKVERLTDRVGQLMDELEAARRTEAELRGEIAGGGRERQSAADAVQAENALLRERINDVAAEVARLTMALEGTGSPIEAILASEPSAGGANGAADAQAHGDHARASLADRIRALQGKASGLWPVS